MKYQHIDLFSGIGGFALSAIWAGNIETIQFCEIEEFPQKVLKKNFPGIPISNDIYQLNHEEIKKGGKWNPSRRTIVTGGFP